MRFDGQPRKASLVAGYVSHTSEWLPRIRALLAAHGARAEVTYGEIVLEDDHGRRELRHLVGELHRLHHVLARVLGVTRADARGEVSAATGRGAFVRVL